jgi:iron complex outermembrane receptor protein
MRARLLCAVLLTACRAGPGFASTASEDFWELSLQQLSQVEVNVASRSSERARDASSSITVFTRRDIEATGVTTVEQLMAFVPGFAIQRSIDVSSLRDTFAIRGRRRGNFNSDVLILRDGLPLNTNRLGGAGQSYFDLPLHNVRQVEVIRGPGSALYGSGAFAGVINIVTDDALNNASVSAGSHDLYAGHLNVSQKALTGNLIAQANVIDRRGPMYRDADDGMHLYTEDTREGRSGHDALLKWKNDSAFASLEQQRRASSGYIMNRFVDDNDNSEIVEVNTARAGFTFGDGASKHDISVAWRTFAEDLHLGFMSREYVVAINAVPALPNGFAQPPRDLVTGVDREASQLFFDWQWTYALNQWNSLSVGAGYDRVREDKSDIVANYDVIAQVDSQYPIATYDSFSARTDLLIESNLMREHGSVFIQDRIQLNPELRWDIALRYDNHSQISEAYSPRSSLVWTATPDTDLKLMYSRAFRAPSIAELYNSRYNQDVGNPGLDPETIDTVEAAWSQRIQNAESTLTLYASDVDDGIDPIILMRVTGGNYEYAVNRSELKYRGVEWELLWQATDDVSLRTAMHHSMHADADIDAAPQNSASLILSFKRERWLASLTALYYDDIETPAQQQLTDYSVVGAILNYNVDRHWRVAVTANNVLNRKYRVYTRRYNVRSGQFADGLPAEPPNQMLTISYNY